MMTNETAVLRSSPASTSTQEEKREHVTNVEKGTTEKGANDFGPPLDISTTN